MTDREILILWKSGLNKHKVAEIYRRTYNQQIRIIRSSVRHRHDGRYITSYEALAKVEQAIYKYLKRR